jgi:oligoendopeptidase F
MIFAHRRVLDRLAVYATHRRDEDLSEGLYQDMASRTSSRITEYAAATAFLRPEIFALDDSTMAAWLLRPELTPYATWIGYVLRYRAHTLSQPEERLLAMAKEPMAGFRRAFGMLNNTDRPRRLPTIQDGQGETRLTNANLAKLLESGDRKVRADAFSGFYDELRGNVDTLSALLDGEIRTHAFEAKARGFASCLEASLFPDQVTTAVYQSLVNAVRDARSGMHEYFRLKRDTLGVRPLRIYDALAPMDSAAPRAYSYEEACILVLDALAPLGAEYVENLRSGLASGWVDRFENRGKRSGAYSGGSFDTFPYILHNFNGTLDSVFTLAHEAGHSMHSLLARRNQPFHHADYAILVAEVASVTNEMLLFHFLKHREHDPCSRARLLNHLIGDYRATVFRQTMFAEFERSIHERIERGGSLTAEYLSESYFSLVRDYHGSAFDFDGPDLAIQFEWARVPHFYYNFYVYKYATGMAAAIDISRRILSGEPGSRQGYLRMLAAGSSRPPLVALSEAGIDLESGRPMAAALSQLPGLVEELRDLVLA